MTPLIRSVTIKQRTFFGRPVSTYSPQFMHKLRALGDGPPTDAELRLIYGLKNTRFYSREWREKWPGVGRQKYREKVLGREGECQVLRKIKMG